MPVQIDKGNDLSRLMQLSHELPKRFNFRKENGIATRKVAVEVGPDYSCAIVPHEYAVWVHHRHQLYRCSLKQL